MNRQSTFLPGKCREEVTMQSQAAGSVYGRGLKGFVEDARCIKHDAETLCAKLQSGTVTSIQLYGMKGRPIQVTNKQEIHTIAQTLDSNVLIKSFHGPLAHKFFMDELSGFNQIHSIFNSMMDVFTTVKPGLKYADTSIYGVRITNMLGITSYHTFTEACSQTLDEITLTQAMYDKMCKDIHASLKAIHMHHYYHNDLKPDNVIYCPHRKRFKLIDWESSGTTLKTSTSFVFGGTIFFNHPLKFYLGGLPAFLCRNLMDAASMFNPKFLWLRGMSVYDEYRTRTNASFDNIIASGLTHAQLHRQFSPHYDNYAFALILAFLADKHNLKPPKRIIQKLMAPFEKFSADIKA